MNQSLSAHRKIASDLSLGSSHDVIYDTALQCLLKLNKTEKHMDFGSGKGDFLQKLSEATKIGALTGVDLMSKPKNLPKNVSWLQTDLNESLPLKDSSFDSISALEIIEHLENPRHVLRELFRILKPQGWVLISTPNNESWRAILSFWMRGHFVAFTDRDYPAHITALNRMDLARAAKEAGFSIEGYTYTDYGSFPGWTRQTWQSLSFGLCKGLRYSDNLFIILKKHG